MKPGMIKQALLASITPVEPLAHSIVGKAVLYNVYHPTYICNCCIALKPLPETVPTVELTLATASQVDATCVRCWQLIKFTQTELDQLKARLERSNQA